MNKSFTNEHRGVDYDLLCLSRQNGWILDLSIRMLDVPSRRFDDKLFSSYEEAREYGSREARRIIDQLVDSRST